MTFRHLITSALVFGALCTTASAQGLEREWTVPYPHGYLPLISSDGSSFARPLSQTAIERYDGSTGSLRDTIAIPYVVNGGRIAFCGNSLYVLAGTGNDSLHLYRCSPTESVCTPTPYEYRIIRSKDVNENVGATAVGLYSIPGYPRVLVWSNIYRGYSSATYNEGRCEEVDTVTFGASRRVGASLGRVSWSAFPETFIRFFSYSMYDIGPSPDISSSNDWMSETHREKEVAVWSFPRTDGKGDYPPPGFGGSIHAGALHHIIRDTVVDDLGSGARTPLPNRSGRIMTSLYPPTYLLKVDARPFGNVMSAYDFLKGITISLDTVPSCTAVWINGSAAVMYMLDTTSRTLTRYRIAPFAVADSISMSANKTHGKIMYPVEFSTRIISAKNAGHKYLWTFGDSTLQTSGRHATFYTTQIGDLPSSVAVIDTVQRDTLFCKGPVVTMSRPIKNIMVSDEDAEKMVFHGCSPSGDKMLVSNRQTMNVYHIPEIPADQAYNPTPLAESYAFGAYYGHDSMRYVLSEGRDTTTYFRFYNTDINMSDLMLVDTMSIGNAPKPTRQGYDYEMVFYNRALFNREQNQHMSFFRARNVHSPDTWVHDGVWLHPSRLVPQGRWLVNYPPVRPGPYQPFRQLYYADATYQSTVLVTGSDWIRSIDLATMDTLFRIDRAYVGSPTEAIQVDPRTIVSTNGILKLQLMWNRERTFSFTDGIKVFRMDRQHSLILRRNSGNVACVVDNQTGDIVEEIGDGFGIPYNGAYDPVRHLLHVADEYNYISTYTIGTPVVVDEEPPQKVVDQRLHVTSTATGRYRVLLPNGMNTIRVFDVTGRCVIATSFEDHVDEVEFAMPHDQHSGVYLIAAYGEQGRSTSHFLYLR